METNTENIRTIHLKVGDTEIGKVYGNYKGKEYVFTVFYGNRTFPPADGDFIHCDQDRYKEMLTKFLNSKEGSKYIWPTEEEIEIATQLVISRESQLISKQEKETQTLNVQQVIEEPEQKPIQNPVDELELINLQKRVKVMLILIIIQFVSIAALVALRVIKL